MAWPTTVASDSELYVAVNNLNTTLNGAIDAVVTSITLTDASSFPATGGYATIGTEAIKYTGKSVNTLTGCTRGADGTVAASHSNGSLVFMFVVADHHNVLKNEIIAVENSLNLTASRLLVSDGSGRVSVSAATATEAGHLSGVTSAIQTQINSKAPTESPTFTGQVNIPGGTAGAPGLIFAGSTTSGFYNSGSGTAVSRAGVQQVRFDTTILVFVDIDQSSGRIKTSLGSAAAPSLSFVSDPDTGIYGAGANDLYISTGGTLAATFAANTTINKGQLLTQSGSVSLPAHSFAGDPDTGLYSSAADTLDLTTNATNRIRISSAGLVSIGVASTLHSTLQVDGSFAPNTSVTSTDITLDNSHYTVRVDASGANRTITLPAASGCTKRIYNIKKIDATANTVTIDGNASETIDGATTVVISTQYQSYTIQSNGTSWDIL